MNPFLQQQQLRRPHRHRRLRPLREQRLRPARRTAREADQVTIEIRGIQTMGGKEVNDVFLTDCYVPEEALAGIVGWEVASEFMATSAGTDPGTTFAARRYDRW